MTGRPGANLTLVVIWMSFTGVLAYAQPVTLSDATLHLPEHVQAVDGRVDVLVHYHGSADAVIAQAAAYGVPAAVVHVQYPGLSSAYRVPYEDPELFGRLLTEVEAALRDSGRFGGDVEIGRLCVSSFSAGYGAVREILKHPGYVERVDAVLTADSMYAAYTEDGGVEPANVEPFVAFAERAAAGEKVFIITHCYLPPGTYAGTHETAQYILDRLDLERRPIQGDWPGGLEQRNAAQRGGLTVLGFAGVDGEAHGQHLRNIGAFLTMLPWRE